jgi:UDP-glucose 4-epimerase
MFLLLILNVLIVQENNVYVNTSISNPSNYFDNNYSKNKSLKIIKTTNKSSLIKTCVEVPDGHLVHHLV